MMTMKHARSTLLFVVLFITYSAHLPGQTTHKRVSPFWTSISDCITTIHLHNNLSTESLTVSPVLYLEDGTQIDLDFVTMGPLANASINVNEVIQALGFGEHFGGAEFRYDKEFDGALNVETEIIQPEESFSYSVESFSPNALRSNERHGVFWLPTPRSEVFFAVHNTSGETVVVSPELRFDDSIELLEQLTVPAKGFAKVRLGERGSLRAKKGEFGSVTIRHDGSGGAIAATGWIDDARTGFSTMMNFTDPEVGSGNVLLGTQVLLGRVGALAPLGNGSAVDSRMVVKNMSNVSASGSVEIYYSEGGAVGVSSVAISVPADGLAIIDFRDLMRRGVIPRSISEASVIVYHSGQEGALMGRVIGISANKTFGFYSVLESRAAGKRDSVYWTLAGDRESVITVANFGQQADDVTVELSHSAGAVILPTFRLASNESRTVNVSDFAAMLPGGVIEGGYSVSGNSRRSSKLVVKQMVVSPSERIALPFYGTYVYVEAIYATGSDSINLDIDETSQFDIWLQWSDSYQEPAAWADDSTSNSGVATVWGTSATRTITAQAQGTANIGVSSWEIIDEFGNTGTIVASPQKDVTVNCVIGVDSVDITGSGQDRTARVKISNKDCPGSSTGVRVAFTPVSVIGSLVVTWPGTNTKTSTFGSAGTTTGWITHNFTTTGDGSLKINALINQCGGQSCNAAKITLDPDDKTSTSVNIP